MLSLLLLTLMPIRALLVNTKFLASLPSSGSELVTRRLRSMKVAVVLRN